MISRCDNDKRFGGLEVKKMMVGHETPDRFILARNEIQDVDRMTAVIGKDSGQEWQCQFPFLFLAKSNPPVRLTKHPSK